MDNRLNFYTRASEAAVCRGSDTPTIYVENIEMYIPLEKTNIYRVRQNKVAP